MYLRELKDKDAPYMLEWMHDDSVVHTVNKKQENLFGTFANYPNE